MESAVVEIALDMNEDKEVITALGRDLIAENIVTEEYIAAVLRREKSLPTGLDLGGISVAIPHTDETKYIKKSRVAIGVLKKAVPFGSMVDSHEKLDVKVVFLLAIKDPSRQLQFLKYLMRVFQRPDLMHRIATTNSIEEIQAIWNGQFKDCEVK